MNSWTDGANPMDDTGITSAATDDPATTVDNPATTPDGPATGVDIPAGTPTSAPLAAIAAALRRERARAGLSLTELARRAGVAKSTLSQLESGLGNPSVETLWALGVALG